MVINMADGGEGTVQSLIDATEGGNLSADRNGATWPACHSLLRNSRRWRSGCHRNGSASGIHLITRETKNPFITTTYGTGELIKACLNRGRNCK